MPAHHPTQLALLLAATLAGCGSHAQPVTRQVPMTIRRKLHPRWKSPAPKRAPMPSSACRGNWPPVLR